MNAALPIIPDSAPFTAEQRSWLNGFLAGVLNRPSPGPAPAVEAKRPLLVLFGSQSGNAEMLAKRLGKLARERGFEPRVSDLDGVSPQDLQRDRHVLIVTSTWGEGDMPDNAARFWSALNRNGSSPRLDGVLFSVLALGDRNYADTFCQAGRQFDRRLAELGAVRVAERVDCDVEFDEPFEKWSHSVFPALLGETASAPVSTAAPAEATEGYGKKNPFPAPLVGTARLNGPESAKETRHVVFSLEGSGLTYEAGDALGVLPTNCPALVEAVMARHSLNGDAEVALPAGGTAPLREALMRHYDVRSWLTRAPAGVDAAAFVGELRKLQPRLYSISSSPRAHAGEVHLTVGVVRYEQDGVAHKGVASSFLAERLAPGETACVFVHKAPHFRVPANPGAAMIMVGPGTGIAPFRAFLHERRAIGAAGRHWLFFGDQREACDFLYRDEIDRFRAEGLLTRLDLAFSRDQEEKIYVQHRMLAAGAELWRWLEEGAHFYVCGDASRMAKDVDAALHEAIRTHGGKSPEEAVAYVSQLKQEKRYVRDVY